MSESNEYRAELNNLLGDAYCQHCHVLKEIHDVPREVAGRLRPSIGVDHEPGCPDFVPDVVAEYDFSEWRDGDAIPPRVE